MVYLSTLYPHYCLTDPKLFKKEVCGGEISLENSNKLQTKDLFYKGGK